MTNKTTMQCIQQVLFPTIRKSFIEALPEIFEAKDTIQAIRGTIEFKLSDRQLPNNTRAHIISQLLNNFFTLLNGI